MPILVRPVREQLEHDRIIRLLEAKWRKTYKVDVNPGEERNVPVKVGGTSFYPDLVLTEEGARKPRAVVEVETGESVNHLEARAQWAHLARSRSSLYLFVPAGSVETATRLASDYQIPLAELWTYMVLGDQVRFTSIIREDGPEPADVVEIMTVEHRPPAPIPVEPEPAVAAEPSPNGQGAPNREGASARKLATPVKKAAAKQVSAPAAPAQGQPVEKAASKPAAAPKPVAPAKAPAPGPAGAAKAVKPAAPQATALRTKTQTPSPKPAAKAAAPKPTAKVAVKAPPSKGPGKAAVKAGSRSAPVAKPATTKSAARPAAKAAKKAAPRAAASARPSGRAKVAAPARPAAARPAARTPTKRAPAHATGRASRTQKRK